MISRNDPCWCGSNKKWKKCHYPEKPISKNVSLAKEYKQKYGILIKTPEQILGIREASKIAATILDELCKEAKAGVTTNDLDKLAQKLHLKHGVIPACLGYGSPPFPKSICTSINEEICHGIPDDKPLKDGDIVNIDVTSISKGFYGDCSRMVMIGKVDEEKKLVTETSYKCLMESISICRPGLLLKKIGDVIEKIAAENNCSVVDQFVGHGVGVDFHEAPNVPHHYNDLAIPLAEGMTFTIEPMINAGVKDGIIDKDNQWEAVTADGKPSGQWEHTILITKSGHEILTHI